MWPCGQRQAHSLKYSHFDGQLVLKFPSQTIKYKQFGLKESK